MPWSQSDSPGLKTKQKLAVRRAHRAAAALEPAAWPWRSAAKFVAAACVGLVLAGLLRQVVASGGAAHRGEAQAVAVAAHWQPEQDGRQWAAEHHLAAACLEPATKPTVTAPAAAGESHGLKLACCLGCHSAGQGRLAAARQIGSFVQTCRACH
jgi:hypothetical protein